jgi:citrate synthase
MPGWIAQWKEQHDEAGGRIVRPRQLYIGPQKTVYVAMEKR